jgi:hypothetical protein
MSADASLHMSSVCPLLRARPPLRDCCHAQCGVPATQLPLLLLPRVLDAELQQPTALAPAPATHSMTLQVLHALIVVDALVKWDSHCYCS